VSALVQGPGPRRAGSIVSSRRAQLGRALGIVATAVALLVGLPAGEADASEPGARTVASGAYQPRGALPGPAIPSFSFESSSADLPAAAQREMATTILRKVQSEARAGQAADVSRERTGAPNDAAASSPLASSPGVIDDAASALRAPDAHLEKAANQERSASPAPRGPPSIETPGSTVRNESGGFGQAHRTDPRSRRRTGSLQRVLPVAAVDSSAKPARDSHSTPTPPGHQAPQPPKDPGGALTAALGGSSSTLFGIFMAALIGLTACGAFRAPTRRAASPSDRLVLAPTFARLERPG
jgi:hypothetical protein